MNLKAILPFIASVSFLLMTLISGPGCANIMPPEGGPRDSLAPVLLKATPEDSLLNFTSKKISFVFNEYVEIEDYNKNLIVSPVPQDMPVVSRKLETISVKLRDELEPNTTYTLNFGRSIKDLNEGNVFRDFTYTFSTGTYFDSLEFRGNVLLAESGEVDTTLTVMLHRNGEDSALSKEKPRYVARLARNGDFHFKNLAPGTYYAYALKDEGGSYRYFYNPEQLFAFADSAVVISSQPSPPLTLYAFATAPAPKKEAAEPAGRRTAADKRLKFSVNLQGSDQDLLSKFTFTFENPLKNFDSSKIRFVTDTTFTAVNNYSWQADSTRRKMTLNYAWKENTLYHFIFEKDFATDSLGQQLLKPDTISFKSKRLSEYGKITLRFRNLDLSKKPVLQFVQNKEVKNSFPLTSASFSQPLFLPGDYDLRILQDENGNGKWDPGVFKGQHLQPELVKPLSRKLVVKANQDIPVEIDVTAPPVSKDEKPALGPGSQQRPATRQPRLQR